MKYSGFPKAQNFSEHHMDVQHGHLWDSIELKQEQIFHQHLMMFDTPIGHPDTIGKTKTYADTNMQMCRQLPAPQHFLIKRILFTFSKTCNEHDMFSIAEDAVWFLWLGQKHYLHTQMISMQTTGEKAPIKTCSFCRGVYVNSPSCRNCGASEFKLNDVGEVEELGRVFYLDLHETEELHIAQGLTFWVGFQCQEIMMRERMKMWCHLEGKIARGVQ